MEGPAALQTLQFFLLAAGDEHLSPPDAVEDEGLPPGVQLGEDVVQQQDGPLPCLLLEDLPLGQLEGQRRRPGLSLGGVGLGV